MLTRHHSFIIILFAIALLVGTSVTVTFLVHTHSEYYLRDNFEHHGIHDTFRHREQARSRTDNDDSPMRNSSKAFALDSTVSVSLFTSNFTFPTRQLRLKYYMGDWFGKSILPTEIPCDEIEASNEVLSDKSVIWTVGNIVKEIQRNSTKDWLIRAYLKNAFEVISSNKIGLDKTQSFLLHFGDSHSHSTRLPVVAKTRFSRFAIEKSTGKPFFDTIIWPMEMNRHYSPVNQYTKLQKEGKVCEWEDKKSTLIWRGGVTGLESDKNLSMSYPKGGPRLKVVSTYYGRDISVVDVAFQQGNLAILRVPRKYRNVKNFARRTDTSMVDQLKYKYILMIEGNDVSTGLKWQLASNSVVFMARPTTVSFLMEDLLVPFVHYVPLKDDYSNLIEMVHWARRNDEKCKWISQQATLFMQKLWMSERAKRDNAAIKKELGEVYQRKFGEALKSCTTNRINGDES